MRSASFRNLLFACGVLLAGPFASAQQVYDGNQNLPPFGSFSGSDFDIVALQNGNLHLHIPVGTWQQRGGKTVSATFVYDTATWTRQTTVTTQAGHRYYLTSIRANEKGQLGLQGSPLNWWVTDSTDTCYSPSLQRNINLYDNYVITDPEGTKHPIDVEVPSLDCGTKITRGAATDGSGMILDVSSSPTVLLLKDGTKIVPQSSWEDTNGNLIGSTDTIGRTLWTMTQGTTTTLTTPLGKQVSSPAYTLYTLQDSNGNSQVYRLDYAAIDLLTNFCGRLNLPPYFTCTEYSAPRAVPAKLTLPTGSFYQFSWVESSPQELQSITLPTGGSIGYTYSSACTHGPLLSNQDSTTAPYDCRATVQTRTVTVNGVSNQWTYVTGGKVTDPLGNDQVHVFSQICVSTVCSASTVETQVSYYQGSSSTGKLLKQVATAYAGETDLINPTLLINLRPISVTTTLDNGLVTQVQTDYETFTLNTGIYTRLNPTEKREYAYGNGAPGSLMRKTDYTYLQNSNSAYTTLNIIDRPTNIILYDGNTGNKMSETDHEYDNYTQTIQSSGAINHDSTFSTSYTTRGNLTAIKRWRNGDGAFLTTRNQYDDAGNVLSTTDPLNHTTSFDFTDSWANSGCAPSSGQGKASLTKLTNPLGQITTYTNYSCTGLHGSVTDPNLKTTTTTFDLLNRPLSISYPDGGLTSNCYSDTSNTSCYSSALPLKTVTTKAITSAASEMSTNVYDDLGRGSQTQLNSDQQGMDYTDTTYDALGRVYTQSNLHRSASAPTDGTTTYFYDALGRTCLVVPPDGTLPTGNTCPTTQPANTIFTTYSGNTTTVTDQAGKSRKSVADALGHLTQVFEDPAGLNYETDYT